MARQGVPSHSAGFTLIEVLVSIAVVSIIAFSGIGWLGILNQETLSSNENAAISSAMDHIRYALGDDERYCKKIIATKADGSSLAFDMTNTNGVNIPSINYYNVDTGTAGPNIVTVNATLFNSNGSTPMPGSTNITLQSIVLKPVSKIAADKGVASLEFTFAKANSTRIVRSFPLYFTLAGGTIEKCSAVAVTDMVLARKCEISGAGYTVYDPSNATCVANSLTTAWVYSNDPYSASCPAGSSPAGDTTAPNPEFGLCRTSATVTTPLPQRTYAGSPDDSPDLGFRMSFDKATNTCKFNYVVGAIPVAGAQGILCTKVVGSP